MPKMTPFPHQLTGATFLSTSDPSALLADEPRVGKTGAAILAADDIGAINILTITTASGRPVWEKAWRDWSPARRAAIYIGGAVPNTEIIIVAWSLLQNPAKLGHLLSRKWDLIIADESHAAKNFSAKRTQSLYGKPVHGGRELDQLRALCIRSQRLWCLTGTPLPHSPFDAYPMLRALAPEKLLANRARGWPDVTGEDDFMHRYCIIRMKQISQWNKIPVVVGGRNEPELRARIGDWMLRRTQESVGIRPPLYEIMPLLISDKQRVEIEKHLDQAAILAAADHGDTEALEMHLGPLRRLTGTIKAPAIVEAAVDEFDSGLDKLVISYWHKDVGAALYHGLVDKGLTVTGIDGSTPPKQRPLNLEKFMDGGAQVFLAQIEAAGEAIDLSAASTLWFAETTFVPRQMRQMSLRITNINQRRQAFVKVCALAHSIDEAVQGRLLVLWTAIRNVLNVHNGD
jgi:SNF2 family DNA or RNA helicase